MTDIVIPEQLPLDIPEIVPEDFKAEHICERCGRSFPTANGLNGHLLAHKPPVACPECGKVYKSAGALGNHRRVLHGVGMRKPAPPKPAPKREPVRPPLSTDDIFQSVVLSLWPGGTVPVRCLLPLMQWREATQQFLGKVQNE